jgi:putative peptide zinc metalloprotease protein
MPSNPPKLRDDLIIRKHQTENGTSVIIKHPVTGKFFRLAEAELFITEQLDGKTPVEVIRQRAEAKFDAVLPIETLHAFLFNLKKNDILEAADGKNKHQKKEQGRIRGTAMVCRIKLCDPCELLKRLCSRLGFLFTDYFVVLSAAAILLAIGVTIGSWHEFRESLPRLYQPSAIPAVIFMVFVVIVVHEFGHGMTCTHFGGEVHEMGFVMILLQPAFYCNVSDAWLFPEKSKRLWVGFAGPYFETFLWALAVFAWRLTEANTWVNFAALSVMATSGIKILLNFNPLIKLDGYYLLSDYLEIPNLRRRSFRYVGRAIEKMFGIEASDEPEENITRRERRILPIYGITALAGSFSILGYILVSAGGSLVQGRTPTAFLVSLVFLGMKFQRRFRRMFTKTSSPAAAFAGADIADTTEGTLATAEAAKPKDLAPKETERSEASSKITSSDKTPSAVAAGVEKVLPAKISSTEKIEAPTNGHQSDKQKKVAEQNKITEPKKAAEPKKSGEKTTTSTAPKKSSRHWRRWRRRAIWVGVAGATTAALFYLRPELRIGGPLNILPVRNADVRTEIDGMIESVHVTEGTILHKGDLIAVLSTRENRSELEKTQGQIQQANAKLKLEVAGPTSDEIEVAKTAVVKAMDSYRYATAKLNATKELFANNLASRIEMEAAEQFLATAKDDLADAQGRLKVLQNGTRPEAIDETKAEVASLTVQQRFLQGQIERAEIRSPVDGIVATPELELKEMAGQVVQKGALITKVFEMRKLTVEIAVPEAEIADVKVGQKVALKVRAYPNQTFDGKVISVATSALSETAAPEAAGSLVPVTHAAPTNTTPARTILVTTEIDNSSLLLKPGMTGHAKIYCGRRRLIDIITRRLARTVKVEFWSWQ